MLPEVEILLNVLPLTPETKGIINREMLDSLPKTRCTRGEYGGHVHESDLLNALDCGQIKPCFRC